MVVIPVILVIQEFLVIQVDLGIQVFLVIQVNLVIQVFLGFLDTQGNRALQ